MGKPITESRKAELLKRAEARLAFARNLPPTDATRDAKIVMAEKAVNTALASKTAPVRAAKKRARKKR